MMSAAAAAEAILVGVGSSSRRSGGVGDDGFDGMMDDANRRWPCDSGCVRVFRRLLEGDSAETSPLRLLLRKPAGLISDCKVLAEAVPELLPLAGEEEDAVDICDAVSSAGRPRFRGISPRSGGVERPLLAEMGANGAKAFVSNRISLSLPVSIIWTVERS